MRPPHITIVLRSSRQQGRPLPRLSREGFQGRRALDTTAQEGEKKPDIISCTGDTPGDLRIRFGTLVDVVDVGVAFSTTYVIEDAQHTYNAANGLKIRYQGTRHLKGKKKTDG